MRIHLSNIALVSTLSMVALAGCDTSTTDTAANSVTVTEQSAAIDESATSVAVNDDSALITAVDWSKIASGEQPATVADYNYPFAIDSQNVQNYADYFNVDKTTAQHNITISTASNEALSKVLDQLGSSYTSHEVIDGEDAKLIIHTTPDVDASSYNYVFAEPFAKGLVLPIEIVPDGVKSNVDPHAELVE